MPPVWLSPALHSLSVVKWLLLVGQWLQAPASVGRERWRERKDLCKGITLLERHPQGLVLLLCSEGAQQEAPGTIPLVLSPWVTLLPPVLSPSQALLSKGSAMLGDIPSFQATGSAQNKGGLSQHKAWQPEKKWVC